MSTTPANVEIYYPESDGMLMAETDLHRFWVSWLIDALTYRYRGQHVYVSGNLLVYWLEGRPDHSISPDAFVVLDCEPGRRRVFKTWEEGRVPNVIWEVTSNSTQAVDSNVKPDRYLIMGVREIFFFDPTHDYRPTPLAGLRLRETSDSLEAGQMSRCYDSIEPDSQGRLLSKELGILMWLNEDRDLKMADASTGEPILCAADAEAQRATQASQRAHQESQAREAAEAEVVRLQKLLAEKNK